MKFLEPTEDYFMRDKGICWSYEGRDRDCSLQGSSGPVAKASLRTPMTSCEGPRDLIGYGANLGQVG